MSFAISPLTQGEDGEDKERRNAKTQRSPEGQRTVFKNDVYCKSIVRLESVFRNQISTCVH